MFNGRITGAPTRTVDCWSLMHTERPRCLFTKPSGCRLTGRIQLQWLIISHQMLALYNFRSHEWPLKLGGTQTRHTTRIRHTSYHEQHYSRTIIPRSFYRGDYLHKYDTPRCILIDRSICVCTTVSLIDKLYLEVVSNMVLLLLFSHTHIDLSLCLFWRHRSSLRLWCLER